VVLNEFKSSVPKLNVTPAEVQFLVLAHSDNAGECAVKNLKIIGEEKRSSQEERTRLSAFYISKHTDPKRVTISSIWPGVSAKLPERFDEVVDKDGNPVFKADGTAIHAVAAETILIGGKVFSKQELEALVASKVQVEEVEIEAEGFSPVPA